MGEKFKVLDDSEVRALSMPAKEAYWWELSKQPDVCVDFRGQRFTYPFLCLCCGKEVHIAQFCYGRSCGPCDCGSCQRDPRFAHGPFSSMDRNGHVTYLDRKTFLAPLSPEGDPDWLKRIQVRGSI